jgi:hypothetical protein
VPETLLFHYTDEAGYKAIVAQPTWKFMASQPPGGNPLGAYFANKPPDFPRLFKLGIPKSKREFYFCFVDIGDLSALPGGRGDYISYSPTDYEVDRSRQRTCGRVDEWKSADTT